MTEFGDRRTLNGLLTKMLQDIGFAAEVLNPAKRENALVVKFGLKKSLVGKLMKVKAVKKDAFFLKVREIVLNL